MRPLRLLGCHLVLAAGALAWGCQRPEGPPTDAGGGAAGPAWFEDVTDRVGLNFVHDAGPTDGDYFMPQAVGSGAALFDFDGDGRLDVYLLQNGGQQGRKNQLYRQLPDGTLKNVSAG